MVCLPGRRPMARIAENTVHGKVPRIRGAAPRLPAEALSVLPQAMPSRHRKQSLGVNSPSDRPGTRCSRYKVRRASLETEFGGMVRHRFSSPAAGSRVGTWSQAHRSMCRCVLHGRFGPRRATSPSDPPRMRCLRYKARRPSSETASGSMVSH